MQNLVQYFLLCFVLLNMLGCSTTSRKFDPDVMVELRGSIRLDKAIYKPGEPIRVFYTLHNSDTKPIQEEIIDGSSEKSKAFEGYNFNAIAESDRDHHLQLQQAGNPLQGRLDLQPNQEQVFCENTFIGEKPGNYLLSFDLRWKNGKRVAFKPVTIKIANADVELPVFDPELENALKDLSSDDPKIVALAREKLKVYGEKAVPSLLIILGKDENSARSATATLISIGRPALPYLTNESKNPNGAIRMRIMYILGQIADPDSISIFKNALLHDPNTEVRRIALRIVGENLADPIAIPLLIATLEDRDVFLRTEGNDLLTKRASYDLGFSPTATIVERQEKIEAWKQWWQKNDPNAFK